MPQMVQELQIGGTSGSAAEVVEMVQATQSLVRPNRMVKRRRATSGEDRLIDRYWRPLAKHPGALGLSDDAAAIKPPAGCDLVLTADGIVAGVHFLPGDPADSIARKALRVNLSDLAAKGAQPIGFLLTLALPEHDHKWLARFAGALGEDARRYRCSLLGGDTVRTSGPVTISVAAFGAVPHGKMLLRSGGKPGDRLVVSGTIGDASLGLLLLCDRETTKRWRLDRAKRDHLEHRYRVPQPRTELAELILRHASAAMDISDGLAGDLAKLCRASGVAAEVAIERVPLSEAALAARAADASLIETILTGGDDYEILAAVPPGNLKTLLQQALAKGVAVTEIGKLTAGRGAPRLLDVNAKPIVLSRPSFSHF